MLANRLLGDTSISVSSHLRGIKLYLENDIELSEPLQILIGPGDMT